MLVLCKNKCKKLKRGNIFYPKKGDINSRKADVNRVIILYDTALYCRCAELTFVKFYFFCFIIFSIIYLNRKKKQYN